LNGDPVKAGLFSISPPQPSSGEDRSSGIRIFREDAAGMQRVKGNFGNGSGDGWLDGGEKGDLDPASPTWKYIAMTLTKGKAMLYLNGEVVTESDLSEISWNNCDMLTIASGAPNFTYWDHKSDNSLIDEFRIYVKALTADEIKAIMVSETPD
jgi:hypothetical protein